MKKAILIFMFTLSILNASTCSTAQSQAEYYSDEAMKYNMNTKSNACKMADNLEQVVNWMGTMKQNSCSGYTNFAFNNYIGILRVAVSKCGY